VLFVVREPPDAPRAPGRRPFPLARAEVARLPRALWWLLAVVGVFTLARFREAFLVLRAAGVGVPRALVPAVMGAMNLVYALAADPLGELADRADRRVLLALGVALLVAADLALALAGGWAGVLGGAALWGLHLAATQGLLSAMVANAAPAELRGTAFGLFNLVQGVALPLGSALAGLPWMLAGPAATFLAGTGFALVAGGALLRRAPTARQAAR
jgi:MFS family permease